MKTLWFRYKHWHSWLINFHNWTLPVLLTIPAIASSTKLQSNTNLFLQLKLHEALPEILILLYSAILVVYIYFSCLENRYLAHSFNQPKDKFQNYYIGLALAFASWSLAFIAVALHWIFANNTSLQASKETVVPIALGSMAGITLLTGLASNICLNSYEFFVNFELYYKRYKESVLDPFFGTTTKKKKKKKVQPKAAAATAPAS